MHKLCHMGYICAYLLVSRAIRICATYAARAGKGGGEKIHMVTVRRVSCPTLECDCDQSGVRMHKIAVNVM